MTAKLTLISLGASFGSLPQRLSIAQWLSHFVPDQTPKVGEDGSVLVAIPRTTLKGAHELLEWATSTALEVAEIQGKRAKLTSRPDPAPEYLTISDGRDSR